MADNRLLILDDDIDVLELLAKVGRRQRYETQVSTSVERFLEAYDAAPPSIIVLDLQYQVGDGFQVMSHLRDRHCSVPIILVSGVDAKVLETARRVGESHDLLVIGALTKPLHLSTLRQLLDDHRVPDADEWADDIRRGLARGEFTVQYQPKVDAVTGRVVSCEALARWAHPSRGAVPPDHFISVAESSGVIGVLTDLVLARAIADCAAWAAAGFAVSVAVNVAAQTLSSDRVVDVLARLLSQHGVGASSVIFEVAETSAMHDPKTAMEVLGRLRLLGISLALDGFGTGASKLAVLQQMPFNELKIDRRFVANATSNRDHQKLVRALAGLARNLELTSAAVGVEDQETWDWLQTLPVDHVQGFGIARPMPADQVVDWLRTYAPAGTREAVAP